MTHEQFISLVRQPETVNAEHLSDLKEMVERYPYFVPARMLMVKSLQQSHSIHFGAELKLSALYCSSRRWLYYYIHPEKKLSTEPYRRPRTGKSSGDYFDMIEVVEREGGDTKKSLKNLAERLKNARSVINTPVEKSIDKLKSDLKEEKPVPMSAEIVETKVVLPEALPEKNIEKAILPPATVTDYFSFIQPEISEDSAKKLIKERKYEEAVEILKQLNLNNPKKSVYFADQIRFLEKIIANSKK